MCLQEDVSAVNKARSKVVARDDWLDTTQVTVVTEDVAAPTVGRRKGFSGNRREAERVAARHLRAEQGSGGGLRNGAEQGRVGEPSVAQRGGEGDDGVAARPAACEGSERDPATRGGSVTDRPSPRRCGRGRASRPRTEVRNPGRLQFSSRPPGLGKLRQETCRESGVEKRTGGTESSSAQTSKMIDSSARTNIQSHSRQSNEQVYRQTDEHRDSSRGENVQGSPQRSDAAPRNSYRGNSGRTYSRGNYSTRTHSPRDTKREDSREQRYNVDRIHDNTKDERHNPRQMSRCENSVVRRETHELGAHENDERGCGERAPSATNGVNSSQGVGNRGPARPPPGFGVQHKPKVPSPRSEQ